MSLEDTYLTDRTRAVIDLGAVRGNYETVRRRFPGKKLLSVLKADAYGHGISGIAAVCDACTDYFAVASVEEGAALRGAGAEKPVLLFGPVPEGRIPEALRLGLTFSVGSLEYALRIRSAAEGCGQQALCQIKADTGFGRTGFGYPETGEKENAAGRSGESFSPADSDLVFSRIRFLYSLPELRFTGTYTHLAVPESDDPEDEAFTALQLARFCHLTERMRKAGLDPGLRHALSTGGALSGKWESFDMLRLGMPVYGQCDTPEHYRQLGLRQAIRWTAAVVELKELQPGECAGYGRRFTAERPTVLGTVSAGYADGYRRCYQGLEILVGGKRVPVVGRVCMDFLLADLTDVEDPYPGMEAVLLGSAETADGGREEITAMEIAAARDSTCGEVTAAISARVPRYYRDSSAEP